MSMADQYTMTGGVEYASLDDLREARRGGDDRGVPQNEPIGMTSDEVASFVIASGLPDTPEGDLDA